MSERPERGSGALGHPTEPDSNLGSITPEPCDRGGVSSSARARAAKYLAVVLRGQETPRRVPGAWHSAGMRRRRAKAAKAAEPDLWRSGVRREGSASSPPRPRLPPGVEPKVEMEGEQ